MILGLHHVQITIPEGRIEEARQFYREALALEEIARPPVMVAKKSFWLRLGTLELHVSEEPSKPSTKAHIAIEIESMNAMEDSLKKFGISLEPAETLAPFYRAHFRDPFGNRIEILSKKT